MNTNQELIFLQELEVINKFQWDLSSLSDMSLNRLIELHQSNEPETPTYLKEILIKEQGWDMAASNLNMKF